MFTVASTDDVTLAVHELSPDAPDDARPLLLCHATGFHGRVWQAVAAELPDRRCYALDFRGFGDSTEPTGPLDWHGFADDVLAVIDHLDLHDVQGVGHSKGGAAMILAELARPGTFDAMVCFEPILFPDAVPSGTAPPGTASSSEGGTVPENHLATITRRRRETFDSFDAAIENFAAKPPLGSLRRDVLDAYVRHGFRRGEDGAVHLKARREHEAMTYETGHGHGGFARLGEVRCPVVVCHGGDQGGPAVIAPLVAEALPQAELVSFPELGHFGPLEDPAAFAAVVARSLV